MMYKSLGSISLSLLLILGASSCGSKEEKETTDSSEDFEQAEKDVKEQIQDVVYEVPPPSEIPAMIEGSGAEFNESLINDNSKAHSYSSSNDHAALNLGVYATDMGYLVSYDKVQEALNYMSSAKKLADNLGVTGSIDEDKIKRFEDNLSNKDSLVMLLNDAIDETESYLKDEDRNQLAALVVTGSFVEGLYLSTALVDTYPKDILPEDKRIIILTPIMQSIIKQRESLDDVVDMLNSIEGSEQVKQLASSLAELQKDYEELNIEEQIENNQANMVLTNETLKAITVKVAEIRSSIVK